MQTRLQGVLLFLSAFLLPIAGMAQDMGGSQINLDLLQRVWVVAGKAKTVQGYPVRGATVTVTPLIATSSRILGTDTQGEFRTEFSVRDQEIREFSAVLTAKKKGFQTAHTFVNFGQSVNTWMIPLTLHEQREEEPNLLSVADLISGLTPKLKQLGPADGLAAKSVKDYARGVADFVERRNTDQVVPLLAKVTGNNPACIGCQTMLALAELGWGDWDDANQTIAESVNATLANQKLGRPEPLVVGATWLTWQHEFDKAEPYLLEALKLAPQDALVLQELGRTELMLRDFDAAGDALKKALAAGAGPETRLLYVESWLGIGRTAEAEAEMNRYLDGRDVKKMPMRVRQVWVGVQNRQTVEAIYAKPKPHKGEVLIDLVQHPPADLIRGIEPAKDQEQLSSILDGAGAKILDLIKNYPNTSSLEAIHQEKLDSKGIVRDARNQKFRYLCLVPRGAWGPSFLEYRADSIGNEAYPQGLNEGYMLTRGFASAAFIFHPTYRAESTFRYLGRQNVNGRNTFVVAFAQTPGKAHLNGNFVKGPISVITLSQGLAWIDTDTYQIIRIHTDLLAPLPQVRLEKETLSIDFNEVHFAHLNQALWLPERVTVTLDWNGRVLRNRHEYSDFKIFDVDAAEKIENRKEPAGSSQTPRQSTKNPVD